MAEAFDFAYMLDGSQGVPAVHPFPVAATQTLVVGNLVILSSGLVTKASASVVAGLGIMAQASTTAAEGTLVKVYPILPGQVWRATADADATTHVLAAALYDINSDQTVDVGDASGGSIMIIKLGNSVTSVYVTFTKGALFP
jgi:type IV secretory pathway VirB9-like protein